MTTADADLCDIGRHRIELVLVEDLDIGFVTVHIMTAVMMCASETYSVEQYSQKVTPISINIRDSQLITAEILM